MIKLKIERISRMNFRSYNSSRKRVLNLAAVMPGETKTERVDEACELILIRLAKREIIFQNVNFYRMYWGVL